MLFIYHHLSIAIAEETSYDGRSKVNTGAAVYVRSSLQCKILCSFVHKS